MSAWVEVTDNVVIMHKPQYERDLAAAELAGHRAGRREYWQMYLTGMGATLAGVVVFALVMVVAR